MAPYELVGSSNYFFSYSQMGEGNGLEWFRKIKGRFSHIVWLNPGNMNYIPGNYWRETLGILQEEFDIDVYKRQRENSVSPLLLPPHRALAPFIVYL